MTPACAVADVPDGTALRVVLGETAIAVVHTEGEWFAIHDVCSHAEVPLSEGEVDGCTLECWLHGSRFDLRTGRPTGPPAVTPVPTYPVSVEGGTVFVSLPQDERPTDAQANDEQSNGARLNETLRNEARPNDEPALAAPARAQTGALNVNP